MGELFEVNGTTGNINSTKLFSSTQWSYALNFGDTNSGQSVVRFAKGVPSQYNMLIDMPNPGTDAPTGQRSVAGTSVYNPIPYAYGIDIIVSAGTTGNLEIDIWNESLGTPAFVTYSEPWNTDLQTTVDNWITNNSSALIAANVRASNASTSTLFGAATPTIRLCSNQNQIGWKYPGDGVAADNHIPKAGAGIDPSYTVTVKNQYAENAPYAGGATISGAGTRASSGPLGVYGYNNAWPDHFLIPYEGQPYEGAYIHHIFRVNLNTDVSAVTKQPSIAIALRRFGDDSIIGSTTPVVRTDSQSGQQFVFASYTAGSNDPFVLGGFYFSLIGDIAGSASVGLDVEEGYGFLLQNKFEYPIKFIGYP